MHRALTIVAFVLRHQADADALQELSEVVSNFIGPDPNLSLAAACSLGSTRLLNWIWNASAASKEERTSRWTLGNYLRSEPQYHQWQFQKAVGVAVASGELGLVKWLFAHFSGCFVPALVVEDAASSGQFEILKLLLEHDAGRNCTHKRVKMPISGENVVYDSVPGMAKSWNGSGNVVHWSNRSIVYAIEKGHKDIARWLYQQVPHESSADDTKMIVESSLAAGYIDLANLVLPPDRNVLEYTPFCPRPDIIEMALETGYFPLNKRCAVASIQNLARVGRLDLIQRIAQLFSPLLSPAAIDFDWTSCWYLSIKEACTRGDLAMVQWLLDHPVGRALCAEMKHDFSVDHFLPIAAEADQVEVMQYLYQEEIAEQYPDALIRAVRTGHLNAMKWLLQHHSYLGRVAIDSVIDEAAKNGHLEILKYFRHLDLSGQTANAWWPRSRNALNLAASNGHLSVVEWLHASGSQSCSTRAMDGAATNGHLGVVKWLHGHRWEGCTTCAMDGAAANGHLAVLQWLFANTTAGCTPKAMELATAHGHLTIVRWLFKNFSLACTSKMLDEAASHSHLRVVHWIHSHFPEIVPTTDLVICQPIQFEVVMFIHANYPGIYSASNQQRKPLVGIISGPDDESVVEWVVQQNPNYAMLLPVNDEPGATIHR